MNKLPYISYKKGKLIVIKLLRSALIITIKIGMERHKVPVAMRLING